MGVVLEGRQKPAQLPHTILLKRFSNSRFHPRKHHHHPIQQLRAQNKEVRSCP